MKKLIGIVSFILLIQVVPNAIFAMEFPDVPDTHKAEWHIDYITEQGIFTGYPDGTFQPDNPITRSEIANVLMKAKDLQALNEEDLPFTDIPENKWYIPAVKALYDHNIVKGVGNDKFNPNGLLSRAEFVQMLYRLYDLSPVETEIEVEDVPSDAWYTEAYLHVKQHGLIDEQMLISEKEDTMRFEPQKPITRAEVAYSLALVDQMYKPIGFREQANEFYGENYSVEAFIHPKFKTEEEAEQFKVVNKQTDEVIHAFYREYGSKSRNFIIVDYENEDSLNLAIDAMLHLGMAKDREGLLKDIKFMIEQKQQNKEMFAIFQDLNGNVFNINNNHEMPDESILVMWNPK